MLLYSSSEKLNIRVVEVETGLYESSLSPLANGTRLSESTALWGISKSQQCPTGAPEYTYFSSTPACPQTHTHNGEKTQTTLIYSDTQTLWRYRLTHTHMAVSDSVCKTKTLTWFTIQHVFTPQPKMHTHIPYTVCLILMLHLNAAFSKTCTLRLCIIHTGFTEDVTKGYISSPVC